MLHWLLLWTRAVGGVVSTHLWGRPTLTVCARHQVTITSVVRTPTAAITLTSATRRAVHVSSVARYPLRLTSTDIS